MHCTEQTMNRRSRDCRYCPPHSYLAHVRCHEQSIKFNHNTSILRKHKENIPLNDLAAILKQKQWLDSLYQSCVSEQEYYVFMLALRKHNRTLETYFYLKDFSV